MSRINLFENIDFRSTSICPWFYKKIDRFFIGEFLNIGSIFLEFRLKYFWDIQIVHYGAAVENFKFQKLFHGSTGGNFVLRQAKFRARKLHFDKLPPNFSESSFWTWKIVFCTEEGGGGGRVSSSTLSSFSVDEKLFSFITRRIDSPKEGAPLRPRKVRSGVIAREKKGFFPVKSHGALIATHN